MAESAAPTMLFTAFEPSGDAHAAPVIAALKRMKPELAIYAWGGPKMEAAGATLVGHTAVDGAMGLNALRRASAVRSEIRAIRRWSKTYRVLAHVAVDSPAANFPICKFMKKTGARVAHLVAPQLWAWGGWRIRKLRARTDLVLCLLPFEEQWFTERDVPARFVGHPRMNRPLDAEALAAAAEGFPQGTPKIAIFPGSREHEVKANLRLLHQLYAEIQDRHHGATGVIVAARPEIAAIVRKRIKVFPKGLHLIQKDVDPAIAWADLCLAVSGTVTLDITRHQKPMIGIYKTGPIAWLGAKLLLRTPFCLLPNIIADREIVPEFVPHLAGTSAIVREVNRYLLDSKNAAITAQELANVCRRYVNKRPAEESARHLLTLMEKGAVV